MSEPSLTAAASPPPETCPPPLAWQEVRLGVEEQGAPFSLDCGSVQLRGVDLGEGPPLWFLNSFSGDRQLFSLLAWLLRDRFRCLLVDADWPDQTPPGALLPQLQRAYSAAIQSLNAEPPVLFGTGFGALTALSILKSPEGAAVRGAILHAGFARRKASIAERILAWGAALSHKTLAEVPHWPQLQEANHRRWFPPIDPSRWNFLIENLGATPVRRWSAMARAASASHELEAGLHEIQTPIQLIRTEGDGPVATAAMNELMVRLPNVREETLHTSGHYAFLTHPHRVAKTIAGFLASLADHRPQGGAVNAPPAPAAN